MVDRTAIDVTMSTIAALIVPASTPPNLGDKELAKLLTPPLTAVQTPAGLVIGSQRDQVEVVAGPNKVDVRDLSGRTDFARGKIPTVLTFFVKSISSKLTSYGVNFILAVPCPDPEVWIVDNVLVPDISRKTGMTLLGGAVTLKISAGQKAWRIKLDPGEGGKMIIDFNASQRTEELPPEDTLQAELTGQFEAMVGFLGKIGL